MLSFFRVNAPYQIVSYIVLLVLLQAPFYLSPPPLLVPELSWMLIGEKMGQGFMIYRDVWDNISPLSAVIYWIVDELFGRSPAAHRTLANLLILLQALYFNYISNERQLFTERNYVPGVLYLLFANVSFDCSTLSPVLMATTFVLLAFGTIIKQIQREGATDEVFELGFYLSVSTLFYLPFGFFSIWAIVSLILYSGTNFRQYALGAFGFLFPIGLTLLFFFFRNTLDDLARNLTGSISSTFQYRLSDFQTVINTFAVAFGLGVLGFLQTINYPRFVNYQTRCQQIMIFWLLTTLLTIGFMSYLAPLQFVIFIAPFAFFAVNFFMLIKRRWVAELMFLGVFFWILFIHYRGFLTPTQPNTLPELTVKESVLPAQIQQQKIVVLGQDEGEYKNNYPATAYLNWELARYDFERLDSYESVISIYNNFTADPPTYVIDKASLMPKLFVRLPALAKRYRATQWKGIYQRI
jgi:hypothetical protein